MNATWGRADHVNPFSTRYVRPGAVEYLFSHGQTAERLVDRLETLGWRGQIVGPHGSGKSTLVETLVVAIEDRGRRVARVNVRGGERPSGLASLAVDRQTVVVVDGHERLAWWTRWRLARRCRRAGAGLVVTTHRSMGLPTLYETRVDGETARRVVARLLPSGSAIVTDDDIERALHASGLNLREALFGLYELYESRTRAN